MDISVLIIGGGISGTLLSFELWRRDVPFILIDAGFKDSASKVSSGAILPMTGQRLAETIFWDDALSAALDAYRAMESLLNIDVLNSIDALFFHRSAEAAELFARRAVERPERMEAEVRFPDSFKAPFGAGRVLPAYVLRTNKLIAAWHSFLQAKAQLRAETMDYSKLRISPEEIRYKDITATRVIFSDGEQGYDHPLWQALPYVKNKGEALLIRIADLSPAVLYKGPVNLSGYGEAEERIFWAGASYAMEFEDAAPTQHYASRTISVLRDWLTVPFEVMGHLSAIRPSSLDRKPFVGWHPVHVRAGILNGMGSKGALHAPLFAKAIVANLLDEVPLPSAVDVRRAARALGRP